MLLFAEIEWPTVGLLLAYSAAVVLASVVGGLLPQMLRLTHTRMQLLISLVGGVMLGIAIFHMMPHAMAQLGPQAVDQVTWGVMLGLLSTFFLLRFFHFHQHEPADLSICDTPNASSSPISLPVLSDTTSHTQCHHHGGHHDHPHHHSPSPRWIGVLLGLGLHTLLDGMALAASVVSEESHGHATLAGFGTFLAVFLHKPLDAVSITSLMSSASPVQRMLVNLGFAIMCPIGAFLFWIGADLGGNADTLAGWGLAFSAGVFLCISLSDLLPEMEFHSHNRVPLSIALLLGIAIAWAIGIFEESGAHTHSNESSTSGSSEAHDHDHSGHTHP